MKKLIIASASLALLSACGQTSGNSAVSQEPQVASGTECASALAGRELREMRLNIDRHRGEYRTTWWFEMHELGSLPYDSPAAGFDWFVSYQAPKPTDSGWSGEMARYYQTNNGIVQVAATPENPRAIDFVQQGTGCVISPPR